MTQQDVSNILRKHFPSYLTAPEIATKASIGIISVRRCLRAMKKREDIEFMIIKSEKFKGSWIWKYRLKVE